MPTRPPTCVPQVPVCQGALKSLKGAAKERIADFVHGSDGFGNTGQPAPKVLLRPAQHVSGMGGLQ